MEKGTNSRCPISYRGVAQAYLHRERGRAQIQPNVEPNRQRGQSSVKANEPHMRPLLRLLLLSLAMTAALPVFAWSFQVSVNGNDVIVTVTGLTGTVCCAGANIDDPNFESAFCSQPCGVGGQGYTYTIPLTCNSVGAHTVYVYAYDPSTNGYEYKQAGVSITDPPPPSCPQFDLIAAGTTVLTHLYGGADPYPAGQTADGAIKISLRTRAALPGTVIYLKVVDPPDAAAYGAPHQKDDNLDHAAGTFPGGKTTSLTLPQSGTVDVVLTTTSFASGDNYQVQASADPNLATDPNL